MQMFIWKISLGNDRIPSLLVHQEVGLVKKFTAFSGILLKIIKLYLKVFRAFYARRIQETLRVVTITMICSDLA